MPDSSILVKRYIKLTTDNGVVQLAPNAEAFVFDKATHKLCSKKMFVYNNNVSYNYS